MKKIIILLTLGLVLSFQAGCSNHGGADTSSNISSNGQNLSKQIYRFQINFDSNSADIKSKYIHQIKEFAGYLKAHHTETVHINGYTDSDGDNQANLSLSAKRAIAVKEKLVAQGVKDTLIKATGYGEDHPIANNNSKDGKYENRRVEAYIISKHKKVYHNAGILEGSVIDAISKKPLAGVSIKVYSKNALITFLTTDSHGKYSMKLDKGNYLLKFLRTGYILANIDTEVVTKERTTIMQLKQISSKYKGKGSAGGTIVNAFNGKGVNSLKLTVRKGWNNKSGSIIKVLKTNSKGQYRLNAPSGYYTIEMSKDSYLTTYFNIIVVGKQKIMTQNGSITPQINKGEIRIILSWNKLPLDLDAHLKTPTINHKSHHIYFMKAGSRIRAPFVDLDLDDRQSYGPETITIYKSMSGTYSYTVQNYSKKPDIKASGAKVQVFSNIGLIKEYHIPSRGGKLKWDVFSYEGSTGKIKTINRVTN